MDWTSGLNIEFPIYKEDGTSFNGLVLRKATVDTVVMSLGDKITGDVYYKDNSLAFTMHEYVVYKDVKYTIVNPPTVVREGLVRDNSELKGMTKYSFEFYHPMYLLNNLPFADVAVSSDETRYLSENKTFSWIGKPDDFIAKLNKNLEGTEWVVVKSDRFPKDKASTLSQVLQFDKNTIGDAMKKAYEEWDIPYVIDSVSETEQYYGQGKRFKVVFGLPSNEIYETDVDRQAGIPFMFKMGQGVGLKNNSRTPRNNKIVTRLSGYGSERNIPYGYPQIVWTGDQSWTDTKNNPNDPTSYPLYKGIVGGRYVKLIKHPFTRTHLMPSVYRDSVNKKVNPFAQGYNPNIELVDYYDAKGDEYPNKINEASPSYEIHEFDTYPQMNDGSANISIVNAVPLDKDLNPVSDWDDSMDDEGNYIQSYFQITLPRLSFDIYACAAITEEMKVNMRSGACIGCTFDVQVDWEDYKNNFYDSNGDFAPDGTQRDTNKYPKSNEGSIVVVVKKDNTTFGTLMPNIYQNPKSGDEFVVLGISLPNEYIESAETKLDEEMKSYMLENNVYYYDYPLKFDEYFLATHTNILSQVKTNNIVHFDFSGNLLQLFVKQITIKYENAPLPQYDITLSDNIEVVLNQIGKVADDVEHLGSLISMLRQTKQDDSYSLGLAQKLSKVDDDTARGLITFLKGLVSRGDVMVNGLLTAYNSIMNTIKSSNYTGDGVADSGWLLTNDYAGSSRLVVDYLYARKKAVFESLEIKELQFTSGDLAQSLASATIERTDYLQVDEQGEETILGYSDRKIPWTLKGFLMRLSSRKPYALARNKKIRINLKPEDLQNVNRVRCYFLAKDENKKIFNLWKVNDLARCQTFNIDNIDRETYAGETHKEGNVYWWRLVKNISTETVTVDGKDYHYFDVAYGFDAEQEANRTGIRTPWCDILSDLPAAGDKVVQFGNTETPARMNIIVSEVNGEGNADAPAIKSYRGVHTFNTDDCWWGGESCRKMMLSPSSGVEFYAPTFKFITEYGIERTQVERGAWLAIPFEEDTEHQTFPDYSDDILDENGNFVSRSNGSPKKYVRKCRYYDRVEHKGSTWLCTIAESHYWRKYNNGVWSKITEAQYKALPQEEKDKCEEVRNYTTDEPSKASNDWTVSAERGQDGSFKSRVFCRTNINIKNANVRGGSYDNPIPTLTKIGDDVVEITWEDGVPQGTEMLWSTVCTFYGDGSNSGWSKPSQETDTETLDIEFSPNATQPDVPVGTAANRNTQETIEARQAQGWYDPSRLPEGQQMVYRAECKIKNGVYETKDGQPAWVISKILGDKGSYYVDDYGIGASRTTHNDITSWNPTPPLPTSQKPYVWKRSRLYNPNTNTYGDATYVCLTGEKGVNGKDGWMITANPANVIITQSLGNNTSSFSSATVSFTAKKGNVSAVITGIAVPTGQQALSNEFNAAIGTGDDSKKVIVSSPKTHGSPAEYYTEGSFTVTINVTDPDTNGTISFDVTVLCYANLLGTWKRSVEAGVETVVAGLTQYLEDEDGNIITSESLRKDINDATQDLSVLSQTVTTQGQTIQNQNTRLSTAEGNISTVTGKVNGLETSTSEIKQTADAIKMSVNSGYRNFILNPKATDATIGYPSQYISSFSDDVMGNVMNVYNPNNGDFQLSCKFDDDNRSKLTNKIVTCYAVVKPMSIPSSGSGMICFGIWSSSYYKSDLVKANSNATGVVDSVDTSESEGETGMTAVGNGWYVVWSTFNAGYIFSEVKDNCGINSVNGSRWLVYGYGVLVGETCPSLEAIMTYTGLRSAGINIENGIVNLYGDKVKFSNSNGTVSGKVWIDPNYGTLHAVNGEFSGSIYANFYRSSYKKLGYDPTTSTTSQEDTTVDLDNDPYNTYIITSTSGAWIPDPENYDGIELNFFCMPWTPSAGVRPPAVLPSIKTSSGNNKIFYTDDTGTVLESYRRIDFGQYLTFKSINGYWYVITK